MKEIIAYSFPRAGFLGNPSDGYFGKTLSFAFNDFCVELRLVESGRMRFIPGVVDDATFASPEELVRDLRLYGYYGGIRLLKAVSKRFFEYCMDNGIAIDRRNFTVSYKINIPRLVGLSGSSAICSAMLKALVSFYGVEIPIETMPTLCLEAERELGIECGFQDRVIQIYNGLVFMDFDREFVEAHNFGRYDRLDVSLLPNLYISYDANRAEESGKAHRSVKRRFDNHNADVVAAMSEFADIAQKGRDALVSGRGDLLPGLVNANFDLRARIFDIADENKRMVMTARSAGASAKFAGSGGAIVGTFEDDAHFRVVQAALGTIGCTTIRPTIATDDSAPGKTTGKWRTA